MMGDELCLMYDGESRPWEGVGTVIKLPDAVSDEVRDPCFLWTFTSMLIAVFHRSGWKFGAEKSPQTTLSISVLSMCGKASLSIECRML